MIEGNQLDSASAADPAERRSTTSCQLDFDGDGTDAFTKISEALVCPAPSSSSSPSSWTARCSPRRP